MLDSGIHQAAGLAALAPDNTPRIVALASHGDRRSELPLLWQLCAAWSALDYPVLVLDATLAETEARPGLLQLLQDDEEFGRVGREVEDWPIVPAARGLAEMSQVSGATPAAASAERARQLVDLFSGYDLIVLYAPARELALALPASRLSPLLPVSTHEPALLSGYHALKQLLNLGKLRPTIVAVMDDNTVATRMAGHSLSRNLQDCARDFLACEVTALTVCPEQADEVHRLALRTLDNAMQASRWNPLHHAVPAMRKI